MKNYFRFLFIFFLLVFLDQFSKFIFSAISICNKNIAWSVPIAPGFFYPLWLLIFFLLLYFFLISKNSFEKIALTFVLTGAFSNIIDRVTQGCVIDFINIKIWPVFNLGDIYITIGVILLLSIILKFQGQTK
jgi:lipoprotein signal peptidase